MKPRRARTSIGIGFGPEEQLKLEIYAIFLPGNKNSMAAPDKIFTQHMRKLDAVNNILPLSCNWLPRHNKHITSVGESTETDRDPIERVP